MARRSRGSIALILGLALGPATAGSRPAVAPDSGSGQPAIWSNHCAVDEDGRTECDISLAIAQKSAPAYSAVLFWTYGQDTWYSFANPPLMRFVIQVDDTPPVAFECPTRGFCLSPRGSGPEIARRLRAGRRLAVTAVLVGSFIDRQDPVDGFAPAYAEAMAHASP